MEHPFLSIVVPAYNEEARLPQTLPRIVDFLRAQDYAAELVVVDDGSTDGTCRIVEDIAATVPFVRLIRNEHRGKGYAVKTGGMAAAGDYIFLCDADLSMPIEEVARFLPPALEEYDVAIGSREVEGARRYDEPGLRHLMGRVFNTLVRLLAVRGFQDTQAGFKCFAREAAREMFPYQTMDGFGFDVEILFIAQKRGFRIVEVPINWYYMSNSRVSPVSDSVRMFREILEVRMNDWRGLYDRR
ncbi:MAG TPA: dolichyl-phosphate beta-glucosyltransferase [Anaerolineae bacterium]|nr:dolichyl-phosphate beta-glucosyltransferase [Anaerolineae bacterium]